LLAAVFVAAGCGSSGRHSTTTSIAGGPYTLHQVKAAFAAQGITLQKMLGSRDLVVLKDSAWDGPIGYQRTGGWTGVGGVYSRSHRPVPQFFVFLGNAPHARERGNVWVEYAAGEGVTVRAAFRKLH
jgi:hypothetical protein